LIENNILQNLKSTNLVVVVDKSDTAFMQLVNDSNLSNSLPPETQLRIEFQN